MRNFTLIFFCLLVAGCTTTKPVFHVSVDSINSGTPLVGKKCIVAPGAENININDLQFREFASYVERVLVSKGYEITDDFETADVAVLLGYGIGDPEEHYYTYSVPVWGQTGVSSSTTTGSANTFGNIYSYGSSANLSGTTSHSSTTTYTPSYGVVGSSSHVGSFVTYTRYIFLQAYDLNAYRQTQEENQLWKTEIVSTGSSGDLRRVFPILIAGAMPYVGENTGQKVKVQLHEDNEAVLTVKGIQIEETLKEVENPKD